MSEIDYIRMVTVPTHGATTTERISEAEACEMRDNVFMRQGSVSLKTIENGYSISDSNGQTLITAVFKEMK